MKVETGGSPLGLYHDASHVLHGIMDGLEAQGDFEEAYEVEQTTVGALLGQRPLGDALAPYPYLAAAIEAYLGLMNSLEDADSSAVEFAIGEVLSDRGSYGEAGALLHNFPSLSAALDREYASRHCGLDL